MSDDIADFLRRAAQRRGAEQPVEAEILDAEVVEVVEDAEILDPGEVSGTEVAQSVARHMDTSRFGQRASTLGAEIDRADDRMESHLHEKFEHRLGSLGGRTSQVEDSVLDDDDAPAAGSAAAAPSPADVIQMLSNGRNLPAAILLSEILRRPEERW